MAQKDDFLDDSMPDKNDGPVPEPRFGARSFIILTNPAGVRDSRRHLLISETRMVRWPSATSGANEASDGPKASTAPNEASDGPTASHDYHGYGHVASKE